MSKKEAYQILGVADAKAKACITDPLHVCDLINGGFLGGKQVLEPAKMKKIPGTVAVLYRKGDGGEKKKERTSDGMFQYDEQERFLVISLENQHDGSYIMPIRDMLITALLYDQQVSEKRKEHRAKKELKNSVELLSGITRADRLAPVCCIVFYHGEEPWEGPTRLHELIGFPQGLEELRELCPDFRINLVDWKCVNPKHFKTGLRQLFELLPYAKDKEKLCDYVKKNQSGYSDLTEECCDLLEGFLGIKALDAVGRSKHRNDRGGYNMCTALEELVRDSKEEGREEGREEERKTLLLLMSRMVLDGEADKIPLMGKDPAILQEMQEKYGEMTA